MRTTTVWVHEWATGGGRARYPLDEHYAREGTAMRRALAGDFARVPGVRVVVTLDDRLPDDPGPWMIVRMRPGSAEEQFARLAAESDLTVLIAPETGGILAACARALERAGGRSLGSTPEAIEATADKLRLGAFFEARGIATPECRRVCPAEGLPRAFSYPAVLKPIDGAGSLETFDVPDPGRCPTPALGRVEALLQPRVPGVPMSASFLVGPDGRARLIGVGWQRMNLIAGRYVYQGGRLPAPRRCAEGDPRRAVESVAGLRGFVGVDFLWDEPTGRATVLEINPRPTTSCVGLVRLLRPGVLGRAWLDAVTGRCDEETRELAEIVHARTPIGFEADGKIRHDGVGAF